MTVAADGLCISIEPISKRLNMTSISSASNLLSGNTFASSTRGTATRVSTAELATNYQDLLARTVAAEAKDQQTGNPLNGLSCFVSDSSNQGALQNACSPEHWAAIQARKAQNTALEEAQKGAIINTYNDTGIDPYAAWDSYLGKQPGSTIASVTGDWSKVAEPDVASENSDDLTVIGGTASGSTPQETAPESASRAFATINARPASTAIEPSGTLSDELPSFKLPDLVAALLEQFQATLKTERM